jgi:Trp operon repressor
MKKYSKALKAVAEILGSVERKKLERVLEDLITPAEIHDINERIKIFKALLKGDSQRKVAEKLGVSVTKVTRGAHVLRYGTGGAAEVLKV